MQITIHAIENNARSNNIAVLNGLHFEINDAPDLIGSEKQVAWANEIRENCIYTLAEMAFRSLTKDSNGVSFDADDLDRAIGRVNNEFLARLASMLQDAILAKAWIDNRSMNAQSLLQAAIKDSAI